MNRDFTDYLNKFIAQDYNTPVDYEVLMNYIIDECI
jgi:hypothetical protein